MGAWHKQVMEWRYSGGEHLNMESVEQSTCEATKHAQNSHWRSIRHASSEGQVHNTHETPRCVERTLGALFRRYARSHTRRNAVSCCRTRKERSPGELWAPLGRKLHDEQHATNLQRSWCCYFWFTTRCRAPGRLHVLHVCESY